MNSYVEIIIILILLLCNGLLAMAEMSIVSSRKARLHQWSNEGDRGAQLALSIANSPNEFLSTVQIGITLVGIFTGAYGGATIAEELATYLKSLPALAGYADALAFGLVVAVITYLSLILGELVPKRLALHSPEKIARWIARPMKLLSGIAKPVVALLSASTSMTLRIIGVKETRQPQVTEAEIQILVEQATAEGIFEEVEQDMIARVLMLGDRKVTSVMIPRTDVIWIDVKTPENELTALAADADHDYFPVGEGSVDNLLGVVSSKEIMRRKVRGQPIVLSEIMLQPAYVPENTTALKLLERLQDAQRNLALVLDEYGGFQGMVTIDDVIRAIVGQLPSQGEATRWEAHKREDGSWLVDAQMPIGEFKARLEIDTLLGEDESQFDTLAGFILFHLERIPRPGEYFDWEELRFEIVDMDRHRIDKVLIQRLR
jgi:putative hemolysin